LFEALVVSLQRDRSAELAKSIAFTANDRLPNQLPSQRMIDWGSELGDGEGNAR
jgi:hypothetical protein